MTGLPYSAHGRTRARLSHQLYQAGGGRTDVRVHHGVVELGLRGQLGAGRGQPGLLGRRVLGAASDQPAGQFLERGRSQEDQHGLGTEAGRGANLARTLR